jgi:hypothetical protein
MATIKLVFNKPAESSAVSKPTVPENTSKSDAGLQEPRLSPDLGDWMYKQRTQGGVSDVAQSQNVDLSMVVGEGVRGEAEKAITSAFKGEAATFIHSFPDIAEYEDAKKSLQGFADQNSLEMKTSQVKAETFEYSFTFAMKKALQ